MVALDLMLKAAEWGAQIVEASNNKAQRRGADLVEKSAILVAGLRHMDQRFTGLFLPLVFFDLGSWPIERRRSWAEDALAFIHGDRVVDRLGQAITYLEGAPIDDRQLSALVLDLCDITHVALWGSVTADVSTAPEPVEPSWQDGGDSPWWSWADSVRYRNQARDRPAWETIELESRSNPDDLVAPSVSQLVALMRSEGPDATMIARTASACLAMPRDVGPRDYTPPTPQNYAQSHPRNSDEAWLRSERRATGEELHRLDNPRAYGSRVEDGDDWPEPLNTVSPLRDFADLAGRRFQQILLVVRASFPGLPEPTWLWETGQ
jgi:hypothetical protein